MSWFLSNSVTDSLFQPLEILVEKSLLLQYHVFGLAQSTRSALWKYPEAIGSKIVLLSGLVHKRWEIARLNILFEALELLRAPINFGQNTR